MAALELDDELDTAAGALAFDAPPCVESAASALVCDGAADSRGAGDFVELALAPSCMTSGPLLSMTAALAAVGPNENRTPASVPAT